MNPIQMHKHHSLGVSPKRKLLVLAFLSLVGNIVLVLAYFASDWKHFSSKPLFELPVSVYTPQVSRNLEMRLVELWQQPFDLLVQDVQNSNHDISGFSRGELALAVLKARDDVDISDFGSQIKWVSYALSKTASLPLNSFSIEIPVDVENLPQIASDLKRVAAPFGLRGLFTRLKNDQSQIDVKNTFLRTDEWLGFDKVFSPIAKDQTYALAFGLSWDQFDSIVKRIRNGESIPLELQLLQWSKEGVCPAAQLLAQSSRDVICSDFSDSDVLYILGALPHNEDCAALLAVALLKAPRKPQVWNACRKILSVRLQDESLITLPREDLFKKLGLISLSETEAEKNNRGLENKAKIDVRVIETKDQQKQFVETNLSQVKQIGSTKKDDPKTTGVSSGSQAGGQSKVQSKSQSNLPSANKRTSVLPHVSYVVQKSESLQAIAKSLNIPLIELKKLNPHLASCPKLAPGTFVKVPQKKNQGTSSTGSPSSSSSTNSSAARSPQGNQSRPDAKGRSGPTVSGRAKTQNTKTSSKTPQ